MLPKDKSKIEEYKKKLSDKAMGNKNSLGMERTDEHKMAIAKHNIEFFTGRKQTIESIKKRVLKMAGKNNPAWKGGITEIKRNKRLRMGSPELSKKFSEMRKGKKSPNWKGGITPINKIIRSSMECKLWRKAVFERDNYTCIWCGARSGNGKTVVLNADHIKPFAYFPELRFAIDNGRTLCIDCHKTTDTYAGKIRKKKYYGRNNNSANTKTTPSIPGSSE